MEYEVNGNNLVILLPEEIDHHNLRPLQQDTDQIIKEYGIRRIVFDFSNVTFMDSSGIGGILGRYKRMREMGGDIVICGAGRRIARILRMSGIEKIAGICADKAEALK